VEDEEVEAADSVCSSRRRRSSGSRRRRSMAMLGSPRRRRRRAARGHEVLSFETVERVGTWVARGRDEDAREFAARVSRLGFSPRPRKNESV